MTAVWLLLAFIVAMVASVPIGVAMGIACFVPTLIDPTFTANLAYITRSCFASIDSTVTLAIPLFMLSGAIMTYGGLAKRLFDIIALVVGRIPGGMPSAVVITCLFYGAISGSGGATAVAVGTMCIPILVELGYDKTYCGSLVAAAGGLGIIIPPSVPFLMYSLVTDVSVADLFIAGIIPGILIAAIMIIYTVVRFGRREDKAKIAKMNNELKQRGVLRVLADGFWALMTPVIILGGIYSGIVTPTEAACISVVYSIIVCLFIYKTINLKQLANIFVEGVRQFAPLGIMLVFAMVLMKIITLLGVPTAVGNFINNTFTSKVAFLIALNIIFLIIGMFVDVGPAILIIAPIIMNSALNMNVDPTHLGVIMIVNLAIGLVSPPFGMTLFVTAPLINESPLTIGKKSLPYIVCLLVALIIITFVPWLSLALV